MESSTVVGIVVGVLVLLCICSYLNKGGNFNF